VNCINFEVLKFQNFRVLHRLISVFPRPLVQGSSVPSWTPGACHITPLLPRCTPSHLQGESHSYSSSAVYLREASASLASLLSPSILLCCTAKSSSMPLLVSHACVDCRFPPASPHHLLPICTGSCRLEPSHHQVIGSLPPLKYLAGEPSRVTRTVLI
jgi:hypothetical protein